MSVTYSPTSAVCVRAFPGYRGAPVRRDALELHASCTGLYDDIGPVGPYEPGCPCMCECHAPDGLPDWMRPQEGAALEEALATEARIRAMTEHLEQAHPILGPGRLADVVSSLKETCPECRGDGADPSPSVPSLTSARVTPRIARLYHSLARARMAPCCS